MKPKRKQEKGKDEYMASSFQPFLLIIIILIYLGCIQISTQNEFPGVSFPAIFIFGDSTADPGNNNDVPTIFRGNFPPYGRDFKGQIATGRFCNGKLVADFLASKLGIKELVAAYLDPNVTITDLLTGVSFGSAGAGYDSLSSEISWGVSLSQQLKYLARSLEKLRGEFGKEEIDKMTSDALYVVSAGGNDFQITYLKTPLRKFSYTVSQYINLLIQSSAKFYKRLYKIGARNIVVFGVPPLGCLPFERTLDGGPERNCDDNANSMVRQFQTELVQEINKLAKELNGSRFLYFDSYSLVIDLIHNATNYGFENTSSGCCGTGTIETGILCNESIPSCSDVSKYLFWDSIHPTERANEIIADQLIRKMSRWYQDVHSRTEFSDSEFDIKSSFPY